MTIGEVLLPTVDFWIVPTVYPDARNGGVL